ncbi:MAG: polymerase sigma-70 factor, subfamily [Acidimicrobiaceae bacterium]|jgi:RNA polymerase sigma-70 factor (ECF subfamily)|nr:polymerase sigma-70 factor, subfamily [Acidimicrobiaceae bacterium]
MIEQSRFAAIVAGAQRGEELAVAVLFADLQPRLLRFLRAQAPEVAEDIASEVWIGIARGVGRFEGDAGNFRAWAFSIARRRVIDHRRRSGHRPVEVADDHERMAREVVPPADDAAIANLSAERAVDLIRACLPPDHAEVVLLRVLGDLDAAQVAEVMGRTVSWVRVTQHRALRRLAERVGSQLGVTP